MTEGVIFQFILFNFLKLMVPEQGNVSI